MCGIFGVIGGTSVINDILSGLTKLEYRGYDSSGIAYVRNNQIETYRAEGKLNNLKKKFGRENSRYPYGYWAYKMGNTWYPFKN